MTIKQFSNELKKAREKAGITLQKIAAKTRIDIKFLIAIEEGNFSFLPDIYVKAFIKQYAKVIGLNEDEEVQKYLSAKEGKSKEVNSGTSVADEKADKIADTGRLGNKVEKDLPNQSFDDNTVNIDSGGKAKKQKPLLIGGSVVVILLIYLIFFNSGNDIIVEEKPYDEVLQETPRRFIENDTERDNEPGVSSVAEDMKLTITNTDSTDSAWVFVVIDDTTSQEFLLLPGISITVSASNNFQFTLGNSGVIKLMLDNTEIAFDGGRGAVRYFKIDKNGIQRIYSPPQISQQ